MENIFLSVQNFLQQVALHEVVVWTVVFGVICLYFVTNLFVNVYGKYTRRVKKSIAYLRGCVVSKSQPNVSKLNLPKPLADSWQNYTNSDNIYPSEVMKFVKKQQVYFGLSLVVLCLSFAFALLAVGVKYPFAPILLFMLWCVCQLSLIGLKAICQSVASKKTLVLAKMCDKIFGQSKLAKKQIDLADMCMDKTVDDVVEKINFFKAHGISDETAKEVASLLSDDRLNKIRTQDQQKRLNLALNGLLQVMSKNQQDKQVS